ncbi:MAG: cell envelope integrity protein CreD [Chitinophagaceae bacterium]
MDNSNEASFWQKNKLIIKSFFIAFLVLLLLIPTFIIMFLVNERKERKQEVTREIGNKWAGPQTLAGPYISVPYTYTTNNNVQEKKILYLLPAQLNIQGILDPSIRYRSIYKVPVYTAQPIVLKGKFAASNWTAGIEPSFVNWQEARLCIGVSDLKGLKSETVLWNGTKLQMQAGLPDTGIADQGLSVPIALDSSFINKEFDFSVSLVLQGSEKLYCLPMGATTSVQLKSTWTLPAFDGKYLPDSEKVNKQGFEAQWQFASFNRDFSQQFTNTGNSLTAVRASALGVILLSPVDAYGQTMRSLKYAILIIALSFFALFFTEIFQKRNVHPLQYILIGMALVLFYTLLLSISEYIAFPIAYLTAAAATVSLLAWYTHSIFRKLGTTVIFGVLLSTLYLFIYILIQMEDNALLFGSIGLFVLLATTMYLSRKVDWYGLDTKNRLS